jgi:antitoxin component YwqK of YwqJK toxin-antitoxin module
MIPNRTTRHWAERCTFVILLAVSACKGQTSSAQSSVLDSLAGREKRETKYDNGQKKENFSVLKDKAGNYVKDGPYESFHQSGQKSEEGAYEADERDGHWQAWDENGKLTADINYKRGKREGAFTVYADGKPTQTGNYSGDQLSGVFKYFALEGVTVSGTMNAGAPVGAWVIADTSGKVRARAKFRDAKLDGEVESIANDGAPRPKADAPGCAGFGGYTLGKIRFADAVFGTFERAHAFPDDAGENKFSGGRMLSLGSSLVDAPGVEKITLVFDRDDMLTAIFASAKKQQGSDAYADVFKRLHAEYSKRYSVISASIPFVGDCHAEYKNDGCSIVLDAPHLNFDMDIVMRSDAFTKQFKQASNAAPSP